MIVDIAKEYKDADFCIGSSFVGLIFATIDRLGWRYFWCSSEFDGGEMWFVLRFANGLAICLDKHLYDWHKLCRAIAMNAFFEATFVPALTEDCAMATLRKRETNDQENQ